MSSIVRRLSECLRRLRQPAGPDWARATEDIDPAVFALYERVRPYTMTNLLRIHALVQAVEYLVRRNVEGALVECGVWRGGSVMAALLTLVKLGVTDRDVYLYDTFEGMTQPGERDVSPYEQPALATWRDAERAGRKAWDGFFRPDFFSFEQVRQAVQSCGYPESRIHFVKGEVEETIPATMPAQIALLRLDTDWYESTRHELVHLYPRIVPTGVLIVDDYGHWQGCRQAVDEYFSGADSSPLLLNRIDYAARIGVKS